MAKVAAVGLVAVPLVIFAVLAVRGDFGPRPYWVIPSVVALLPRDGDTSFMPWQVIVAAGASVGVALLPRSWAIVSAGFTLLVMIGCVAVGQNYPSDTLAAVVVGAGFVAVLLPLRHRIERRLGRRRNPEAIVSEPQAFTQRRASVSHRIAVMACVVVAAVGGYTVARVQEHGTTVALSRANARLANTLPSDLRVYGQVSIDDLATGKVKATHARAYGKITYVHAYEPDGDVHLELRAPDDAFVVLEVAPELPQRTLPHAGETITAWGIVRKDGLHQWWELHPLVGWVPGKVTTPSSPDLQD